MKCGEDIEAKDFIQQSFNLSFIVENLVNRVCIDCFLGARKSWSVQKKGVLSKV